jgi:hypothetical protein
VNNQALLGVLVVVGSLMAVAASAASRHHQIMSYLKY